MSWAGMLGEPYGEISHVELVDSVTFQLFYEQYTLDDKTLLNVI